jgi:hypothetical protein
MGVPLAITKKNESRALDRMSGNRSIAVGLNPRFDRKLLTPDP